MDSNENTDDTQLDQESQESGQENFDEGLTEVEEKENGSVTEDVTEEEATEEDAMPCDEDLPPLDEKLVEDICALIHKRGAIDSNHPRLKLIRSVELSPEQKLALDKCGDIVDYLALRHGDRFFTFNNKLYSRECVLNLDSWKSRSKSVGADFNGEVDSEQNYLEPTNEIDRFFLETYNQDNFSQDLSEDSLDVGSETSLKACFEGSPIIQTSNTSSGARPDTTKVLSRQIQLMVVETNNLKKFHAMALRERDKEIGRLKKEIERLKTEKVKENGKKDASGDPVNATPPKAKSKESTKIDEHEVQERFDRYHREFAMLKKEFETYLQRFREDDPVTLREAIERYRKYETYIITSKRKEYLKELRNYKHALQEAGKILQEETNRFAGNRVVTKNLEKLEEVFNDMCDKLIEEKKRHDQCWSTIEKDLEKRGGYLDVDKFIKLDLPPLPTLYPFYQDILDQIPDAFRDSLTILQILAPLYLRGELMVPVETQ